MCFVLCYEKHSDDIKIRNVTRGRCAKTSPCIIQSSRFNPLFVIKKKKKEEEKKITNK